MFSKKPSFEESPLQDLSEDQMNQVAGGCDSSSSKSWNWKHRHHHHHHHRRTTKPVTVEVIIVQNGRKSSSWNSSDSNGYNGGSHW